jgi:hypothetical protein
MKIGKRHLQLFILLFAASSLLIQLPSEVFADSNSDGSVDSTSVINDSTTNGPTLANSDQFGWSVANIGDLDGDGVNDLAVGATYDDMDENGAADGGKNRGAVHIMFMESDGSVKSTVEINDSTENGPTLANNDRFGASVENIGDFDGNGVNDLAVGASYDNTGGKNRGAVHIMFMESDGSVKSTVVINDSTTNGPTLSNSDLFGTSVANIGDLDGDGVNDLAVGANFDDMDENGVADGGDNRGAVHILFMNIDGSVDSTVEINDSTTNGPTLTDKDYFGDSVANIGDLNGDGVNDLAVGASFDDMDENGVADGATNRGTVHIMFMNSDGSVDSTVEINDSTENGPHLNGNDLFGESVENLGDLNGDGVNDLAVGASRDNAGGADRGTIHVMYMNSDGSVDSTVEINSSTENGPTLTNTDRFGISIGEIGDFDGNCITDLAVGAYNDHTDENGIVDGGDDRGAVHIIFMKDENPDVDCVTSSASTSTSGTCSRHVILGNCGTIAINNDEYQIIDTWTSVPTTEVLVGQPVTVTLSTPHNPTHTKIHFASVHTEVFSIPANFDQTAHIDYSPVSNQVTYISQSQLFQVAGATHRISHDPDVKNLEMFEVVFTMIFAKPMDTSHVVVETENKHGIPETLYLLDALKVNENLAQALTLEEKSKFSIVDPEPEMDPEPEPEMDPEPEQTKKEKSKRQRR